MAHRFSWVALVLTSAAIFQGCAKSANQAPPAAAVEAAPAGFTDEQLQCFAMLPESERAVAEKQAVCPISEAGLGTHGMGMPYKISLQGADGKDHTIYLCCKGCEGMAKKDPVGTLAKLEKLMTK